MILSDADLRKEIANGTIVMDGVKDDDIGPCSIDLMLSNWFHVFDDNSDAPIDLRQDQSLVGMSQFIGDGDSYWLEPGGFVLGSTRERLVFPAQFAGLMEGKSSLARLGLFVHVTAGFFDSGFEGYPTLELFNVRKRPILLYPGMPVAQISVLMLSSPSERPYNLRGQAKYKDQGPKPAPSQYHRNFWR